MATEAEILESKIQVLEAQMRSVRESKHDAVPATAAVVEASDADGAGKGRIRFPDGTAYVGEWIRGVPSGSGSMRYPDGTIYEGQWADGLKHGKGSCYFIDGLVYKGSWKDDQMHGEGELMDEDGVVLDAGPWSEGVSTRPTPEDGVASFAFAGNGGHYTGSWADHAMHGDGSFVFPSGDVYKGSWSQGVMHGFGVYTFSNGCRYRGGFVDGVPDTSLATEQGFEAVGEFWWPAAVVRAGGGAGVVRFSTSAANAPPGDLGFGMRYVGEWRKGHPHGQGAHYYEVAESPSGGEVGNAADALAAGLRYEGLWKNGLPHGRGKLVDRDEEIVGEWWKGQNAEVDLRYLRPEGRHRFFFKGGMYDGEWREKLPNGKGQMIWADGTSYVGGWRDFRFHGRGTLQHPSGAVYEGFWREGEPAGEVDLGAATFDARVLYARTNARTPLRGRSGDAPCGLPRPA